MNALTQTEKHIIARVACAAATEYASAIAWTIGGGGIACDPGDVGEILNEGGGHTPSALREQTPLVQEAVRAVVRAMAPVIRPGFVAQREAITEAT